MKAPARVSRLAGLAARIRAMVLGWGCVGLVYIVCGLVQAPATVIPESRLDQLVPFVTAAIWPYLSFFVLIALAFLRAPMERVPWLRRSFQGCALVAGLCYVVWPTTLVYPAFDPHTINGTMLRMLTMLDSSQNCAPSLHAALAALAAASLFDRDKPLRTAIICIWAVIVCLSIVFLRRHLFFDLFTGLALAAIAGPVCARWANCLMNPPNLTGPRSIFRQMSARQVIGRWRR